MNVRVLGMTRKEQVAEQLKSLLERHNLVPADIERLTDRDGKTPVSAVTVRRILRAEARTEPEPTTLRRIAEAVGEQYLSVFAEPDAVAVDPTHPTRRFYLRFLGAAPPDGLE